MGIIIGIGTFFLWYLIALVLFRKSYFRGSAIISHNDFAPIVFILLVPLLIFLTNFSVILASLWFVKDNDFTIQLLITNIFPGFMIWIYFVKRNNLIIKQKLSHDKEKEKKMEIENWLNSLKEYNSDLEINFYIYTTEDQINGIIIAKCKKSETEKALIESKSLLPDSVKLEIENNNSDLLH